MNKNCNAAGSDADSSGESTTSEAFSPTTPLITSSPKAGKSRNSVSPKKAGRRLNKNANV